jgi:hypothetical protein
MLLKIVFCVHRVDTLPTLPDARFGGWIQSGGQVVAAMVPTVPQRVPEAEEGGIWHTRPRVYPVPP